MEHERIWWSSRLCTREADVGVDWRNSFCISHVSIVTAVISPQALPFFWAMPCKASLTLAQLKSVRTFRRCIRSSENEFLLFISIDGFCTLSSGR